MAGGLIVVLKRGWEGRSQRLALLRPLLPSLLSFVFYNLLIGFRTTGIDNMAHLGGLVTGAAFAAAVSRWPAFTARIATVFVFVLSGTAYATRQVSARTEGGMHVAALPNVGAEIRRLEHLIARRPDSIEAYTALGTGSMEARRFEDAVHLLVFIAFLGKRCGTVCLIQCFHL